MSTSDTLKVLFVFSMCVLAIGKCIETDSGHPDDVMTEDGDQHQTALIKRAADKVPCKPLPRAILEKMMGAAFNPRYMSIEKPEVEDALKESLPAGQDDEGYWKKKKPPLEAFHVHQGYTRILHEEPIADYYTDVKTNHVKGQDNQYKTSQGYEFAVTQAPPMSHIATTGGHRKRHRHPGQKHQPKRTGQPGPNKPYGQNGQEATLEKFKMDDFEQGEPAADPAIEQSPPSTTDGPEKSSASEKFVKSVRAKRTVKNGFPWACESKIDWIDLGPNHFPRFLRSVVCTNEKCWFGHFQCRPKAFTVKVLRRRKDSCSPEDVQPVAVTDDGIRDENAFVPQEFREQWVFEERAVTFCCECAA